MRPKQIGIIGFDGAIASHLTAPADVFTAAVLEDGFGGRIPCYQIVTIGLTAASFRAESGVLFTPQTTLKSAPELDTIMIAGGSGLRETEIADLVADWVLSRGHRVRRVVAICSGIYGLAPTGVLDGRQVTVHWRFATDVVRRFPKLRVDHKKRLVKDGPYYTSAGLTAGIDLSLALVEEDYGRQLALSVSRELLMYLAPQSGSIEQTRPEEFSSQPLDRFGELASWIMRNLDRELSVEVLARRVCISPAHFKKAFKSVFGTTPGKFVENLRLNEARRRLSTRRKTLHSVAASVGFSSASAFTRAFERRFGSAPGQCLETPSPRFGASISQHAGSRTSKS